MEFDIAVIGAGPAGYCAALKGSQLGAKVVLFENDRVGGTCLNVGCIPTKHYVAKAELLESIRENTEGAIFREAGLFSFKRIFEEKEKTVGRLTGGVVSLLKQAGVVLVQSPAHLEDAHTVIADNIKYAAKKMIIATGSKNLVPPIPGADGKNVIDSTGALSLANLPKSMIIIGAGVIGLEFASIFNAFGCETTALDVIPAILPAEDPEAAEIVFQELKKKGIRFALDARVTRILDENGQKCVAAEKNGERLRFYAEYVLIAAGRAPDNRTAKEIGLQLDPKGFITVNEFMQTSERDVYAAGDVTGGCLLAHSAYAEAELAVYNCLGYGKKSEINNIPRCIFCMPQFAAVGTTQQQPGDLDAVYGRFPFAASGKAMAMGKETGFVKIAAEKDSGRITGCTIVGSDAAEIIHIAAVAIHMGVAVRDFENIVIAHPTLAESIKEAILDCGGNALHIPGRKHIQ